MKRASYVFVLGILIIACKGAPQSVVVVSVTADATLPAIHQLQVALVNARQSDTKYFPEVKTGSSVKFPATFALTLSHSHSDRLDVTVVGLDSEGLAVAKGTGSEKIVIGGQLNLIINLVKDSTGITYDGSVDASSGRLDSGVGPDGITSPDSHLLKDADIKQMPDSMPDVQKDALPLVGQDGSIRPLRCDSKGENCTCLNILSLGKTGTYGAGTGDSTDAFIQYMKTKMKGSVEMKSSFVSLSESFLATYDVIILQDLQDGTKGAGPYWDTRFTKSDTDNLEKWVRNGGAIISMTGYGANTQEVLPTNQLLKFAGISYNIDDIFDRCLDNFCFCSDNSVPFSGWNPAEIDFNTNMKAVGLFHGRSINCSDCIEVAKYDGKKIAVAKKVDKGRVFAFASSWVTYTSQWGLVPGFYADQTNCIGHTAKDLYSVPQFWYNVFRWSVPDAACFNIVDAKTF